MARIINMLLWPVMAIERAMCRRYGHDYHGHTCQTCGITQEEEHGA